MGEHEHRVMKRRVVSPPALPGLLGLPRPGMAAEHVAPHDRGPDVGQRLLDDRRALVDLAALQGRASRAERWRAQTPTGAGACRRSPSGSSTLWLGPATKPSSDIEILNRTLGTFNLLHPCALMIAARIHPEGLWYTFRVDEPRALPRAARDHRPCTLAGPRALRARAPTGTTARPPSPSTTTPTCAGRSPRSLRSRSSTAGSGRRLRDLLPGRRAAGAGQRLDGAHLQHALPDHADDGRDGRRHADGARGPRAARAAARRQVPRSRGAGRVLRPAPQRAGRAGRRPTRLQWAAAASGPRRRRSTAATSSTAASSSSRWPGRRRTYATPAHPARRRALDRANPVPASPEGRARRQPSPATGIRWGCAAP